MGCQSSREFDSALTDARATAAPRRRSRSSSTKTASPSHSRHDSASMPDVVELPAFDVPWSERILLACTKGNLRSLRYLLEQSQHPEIDDQLILKMLLTSVESKQKDILSFLLFKYPDIMTEKPWIIRPVHEAIFRHHAGLDVYKVLVFRSPDIPGSWLANDNCDALATVALENDVPFARFLLHRGANARNAHVIGIPILIVLTRMETRNIRKVEQLPEPMLQQTGWVKATEEEKCDSAVDTDRTAMIRLLRKHGARQTIES